MLSLGVRLVLAFLLAVFATAATAHVRVALVIGNGRYVNTPQLANPANDAEDVAHRLGDLGFKVTLVTDASKRAFDNALMQFSRDVQNADAALFYYAGHGMQFQGRNYLMPIDAVLSDEFSLRYEMAAVDDVKAALMQSPGVKILVLDSCRNNPLADKLARSIVVKTRDLPRMQGLAPPERTNGMIIAYSTQSSEVAHDGLGRNSPFSRAFLKELGVPGLEIGALFRRVEDDVFTATDGQQSPELSISMVPEFYINQGETDRTAWAALRESNDVAALKEFLQRYPSSFYAPDANTRLMLVERLDGQTPKSPEADVKSPSAETPAPGQTLASRELSGAPKLSSDLKRPVTPAQPSTTPARTPTTDAAPIGQDLLTRIQAELRRIGCYHGEPIANNSDAFRQSLARYARNARLDAKDVAHRSGSAQPDDTTRRRLLSDGVRRAVRRLVGPLRAQELRPRRAYDSDRDLRGAPPRGVAARRSRRTGGGAGAAPDAQRSQIGRRERPLLHLRQQLVL